MSFDRNEARKALDQLENKGFEISAGLKSIEIEKIEQLLGANMPPDLKVLLMEGVPVDKENLFPNWHQSPELLINQDKASVEQAFVFDIEENNFWHESFGAKPENIGAAKDLAISTIRTWPPLIRIYGHRYISTSPSETGNPIISIWQASDSIVYGTDLVDYLEKEFEIKLDIEAAKRAREVPYWSSVLSLN